jgi:DMSO/TMAO reductase YedYZ molybdopterin-dependent catalytic subunit
MPFLKQDPRVPPGQSVTKGFPVLHVGDIPHIDLSTWRLRVFGMVENPFELSWGDLRALPSKTANLPLKVMLDDDVMIAYEFDGAPIEPVHGGPIRMLVPKRYFWKSAKWLRGLEFLDHDVRGFWEIRGYHNEADPWKEERYSDLPSWSR